MIRSELDVLLDKVQDPALHAELRSQIDRLKQRRSFGLVFEQHIPERVRLPQHPIRVGSQVVSRDDDGPTFEVILIEDGLATLVRVRDADGAYVHGGEHGLGGQEQAPVDSLVVISDFGEPVLPGFWHVGSVDLGGDKPYHVVINGENHHALEALRFTHAGKVDCIYIDPPYNSGARDWKYSNDYVDDTDAYRHSKWLAFMERRLKLAKELLNPNDSVLIVTIDEKEYLNLGLLLEQLFSQAEIEMVTSVISGKGVARFGQFSRVEEYIFTLRIGSQEVALSETNMLDGSRSASEKVGQSVDWLGLRRREPSARRGARPRQFYPVFVDTATGFVHSIGDAITDGVDRASVDVPNGTFAVWPLRPDGTEGLWGITPETARAYLARGYFRSRNYKPGTGYVAVQYLPGGTVAGIEADDIEVTGRDQDGSVIASYKSAKGVIPKRVWNMASHNAETGGTVLLSRLLPNRRFPFPKSLYAVEDTIRFFVKDKPDAVVLDFFAGSGTTAHAVARLNKQDAGRRQSIMVTNNEVSVDESAGLRKQGLRPGDPEWEALGIFEYITRPRLTAAITGQTPEGERIAGNYKFTDEFPMADGFEENVEFLELRYLDADDVDLGHGFDDIAALLWLRAGGKGPIARQLDESGEPLPYVWAESYGVLFEEDRWRSFVSARPETARTAFIVTYSPTVFAGIAAELPTSMDTIRLYDTYLSMFLPERGRA
jgi:adenine-specific DNA-methyltransferase